MLICLLDTTVLRTLTIWVGLLYVSHKFASFLSFLLKCLQLINKIFNVCSKADSFPVQFPALDQKLKIRKNNWRKINISKYLSHVVHYNPYVGLLPKARFPLPKMTARVDGWPVSITRQRWRARVSTSRVDGPCWRVMETGHPSTRAVNSSRQLG